MRFLVLLSCVGLFGAEAGPGVSRELALQRARAISNARYDIALEIKEHTSDLPGHMALRFDLSEKLDPLVIDFRDDSARNLIVNGKEVEVSQSNGHIVIPDRFSNLGANTVEVDFAAKVAEANRAITRYKDLQDGSEYLYTLFVPMDASMEFPCFDQPGPSNT